MACSRSLHFECHFVFRQWKCIPGITNYRTIGLKDDQQFELFTQYKPVAAGSQCSLNRRLWINRGEITQMPEEGKHDGLPML